MRSDVDTLADELSDIRRQLVSAAEQAERAHERVHEARLILERELQSHRDAEDLAEQLRARVERLEADLERMKEAEVASRPAERGPSPFDSAASRARSAWSAFEKPSGASEPERKPPPAEAPKAGGKAWDAFQRKGAAFTSPRSEDRDEEHRASPWTPRAPSIKEQDVGVPEKTFVRERAAPAPKAPEPSRGFGERPRERTPEARASKPPPSAKASPAVAFDGPNVLDALEVDPHLSPGQRETLRGIYVRFAPAVRRGETRLASGTTVDEILEKDQNLKRGQKEAIRTMYDTFRRKAR